ncbi:MAG: hypothetical protein HKN48_10350, partial [Flavobacteriaceae bacterium]|nr:hypothetical protein [Flavobacteriaceae bacterium]
QKEIFRLTHRRMDSMGLLSSEAGETVRDQYLLFHNNFPQICNQNFHEQGREFLYTLNKTPYWSSIQIEKESKEMFPKLMDANFSNWLSIYIYGIKHGFKTWWILAFIIGVFIFSLIRSIRRKDETFEFLFFASSLLLSNAMVTAMASHSIQRYLFYNYFLGFIIVILILRKLIQFYESRSLGSNAMS